MLSAVCHIQAAAVQEFIELVREGRMMQAIKYARGNLSPWASVYLQDLQVTHHCSTVSWLIVYAPLTQTPSICRRPTYRITCCLDHAICNLALILHTHQVICHAPMFCFGLWLCCFLALTRLLHNVKLSPGTCMCAACNGSPSIQGRHTVCALHPSV